jgi:hypothetical protein
MDQRLGSGFINKKAFLLISFARRPPLGCLHVRKNRKTKHSKQMNQHLKSLAHQPPSRTKRAQTHDSSTPVLHPSSIAAGSFGAASTNSNSKLHQFRAVPSNSDQMTPQKSFPSPKIPPRSSAPADSQILLPQKL